VTSTINLNNACNGGGGDGSAAASADSGQVVITEQGVNVCGDWPVS